jgi:uroporphyrinogen decarboxylase
VRLHHVPLANPRPDAGAFVDILMGRRTGPPPLVEYLVDDVVMKPIITELMGREWVAAIPGDRASLEKVLDNHIEFWYRMGHDFIRWETGLPFAKLGMTAEGTPMDNRQERSWPDEHHGTIETREDFERFDWPDESDIDMFALEYINDHLPEGMGLIASHAGGPFEQLSGIMSLEKLGFALMDDPDLVRDITERVGVIMEKFYEHLLQLDKLCVVFPGDDMGFKSGTLISPMHLQQYTLPWHKRFAEMAHDRNLPYFLHSCGNVTQIMDTLINEVKLDGKHSYEEVILPIEEFQKIYGDRVAVLGGFDIDKLTISSPDGVRAHTRFLMGICGERGRMAIGSGSSIASYIPVDNYLAMVDEANVVKAEW